MSMIVSPSDLEWRTHVLTVGATGMLAPVTIALGQRTDHLTVMSRQPDRLRSRLNDVGGKVHLSSVDYHDTGKLKQAIENCQDLAGAVALVVCWIHSSAPGALRTLAEALRGPAEILHVIGSANVDPQQRAIRLASEIGDLQRLTYRCVILGSKCTNSGSRWLTDDEISQGVLEALVSRQPFHVVGSVRPWDRRPQ